MRLVISRLVDDALSHFTLTTHFFTNSHAKYAAYCQHSNFHYKHIDPRSWKWCQLQGSKSITNTPQYFTNWSGYAHCNTQKTIVFLVDFLVLFYVIEIRLIISENIILLSLFAWLCHFEGQLVNLYSVFVLKPCLRNWQFVSACSMTDICLCM